MGEVSVSINNRNYGMECDDGQEPRVQELAQYVDGKLRQIASAGAAHNESHLLVLTCLMMADELLDLKSRFENGQALSGQASPEDEQVIVDAIDHLAGRIEIIAERIQKA